VPYTIVVHSQSTIPNMGGHRFFMDNWPCIMDNAHTSWTMSMKYLLKNFFEKNAHEITKKNFVHGHRFSMKRTRPKDLKKSYSVQKEQIILSHKKSDSPRKKSIRQTKKKIRK
jgi:hypothetical protein